MPNNAKALATNAANGIVQACTNSNSSSLLVIVLDVSPFAWGERDLIRTAQDKKRIAEGKRSVGPAVIEEVIESVLALSSAYVNLQAESLLVVVGVADTQVATLYPRKDALNEWMLHPETCTTNLQHVRVDVTTGIAELVRRAAVQAQNQSRTNAQGAMAAGLSTALCTLNRFSVALNQSGGFQSSLNFDPLAPKPENETVIALQSVGSNKNNKTKKSTGWASRVLMIQASEDRSRDYNAFMNCAFAAVKQQVVLDACYLPAGGQRSPSTSVFLEQACDLTGGIYLAPSGAAQVHGALTEVLYSVFLAPLDCRQELHLPALNKVDFRARCFETGASVDQAFVCNQCLSIFEKKPKLQCPTCQARIAGSENNKRLRES